MDQDTGEYPAQERLVGLPPLMGLNPRWLVLGTFPSPLSRASGEYYGNPRNAFWRILFALADIPFENPGYPEKKEVAVLLHIALWDVIESCLVTGAADTAIREPVYNQGIVKLWQEHGSLQGIVFNGGNAATFYRRGFGQFQTMKTHTVPSTSPANARYSFADKLERWREVLA